MKNFIDFVGDVSQNSKLAGEFQSKALSSSHSELSNWFENEGYVVGAEECQRLQSNKNHLNSANLGYGY